MVMAARLPLYVGTTLLRSVLEVSVVLLGLYLGIDVVRQAGDLGEGYGLIQLLGFVLSTLPARLYDLFPFAVLIGGTLALSRLAAARELVAMRACGFHQGRILASALGVAMLLGLLVMLIGELLAPRLEMQARIERERIRVEAIGIGAGQSLWLRDGPLMVHVGVLTLDRQDQARLSDLRIYQRDADGNIANIVQAIGAVHDGRSWRLQQVSDLDVVTGRAVQAGELQLASRIDGEIFRALATRPRLLPMADILRIESYLAANDQDTVDYRQAFWRRALYPVNLLAMLFSGLALLLGAARHMPPMVGAFGGVSLGIGFLVAQRLMLGLAPVLPVPFVITHLLPTGLFLLLGLVLLRR
ncbi:MAG: LPS export ABC transporter permease LptG [Wenzhouxiangellaceae bacterium]